jgi:hypothetical protein
MKELPKLKDSSQYSWIPTLASSVVMTAGSLPFIKAYFEGSSDLNQFKMYDSQLSIVFCAFFMTYLIADSIFGYLYYPQHMNFKTGWIHHTIYLALIPFLISVRLASVFMILSFMELPVMVLSIGHIVPSLKSEQLFGFLFFVTRIMFHIYFTINLRESWPDRPLYFWILNAIMPMHLYWFWKWVKRQIRRFQAYKKTD